jgi:death on curing protein
MKYLTTQQVLRIHARSIELFGGDTGVRDLGLVESALAQPRASFDGTELYPTLADKAAALAYSLVRNHPFLDGNKRTGYGAMMMFLGRNGHTIGAPLDDHASVFQRPASGELDREGFRAWLSNWITVK